MQTNATSLNSVTSKTKAVLATSHLPARRLGAWLALAILVAAASGALLAQAPQAIGTWLPVSPVNTELAKGAVVALPDNQTLIVGGTLADGTLSDAATIYDPVTNSVVAAGTLTSARTGH